MKLITAALATTALMTISTIAQAAPVLGLTGDKTLVMFDTDNPAVTKTMDVEGVDRLLGIDFRPATKQVFGVTGDQALVTIDLETGAATEVAKMDTKLEIGDAPVIVDFNPAADRLRYMTGTTNHRVHPDTGAVTVDGSLAFEDGDMHKGEAPDIVAAAYINSHGKPEKTAMYNVDATIGALIQQTKPNDGTLKAIGKFGIEGKAMHHAIDVQTTADGTNTVWLVADNMLYTVDLKSGAASSAGEIAGTDGMVRDFTVLPAM